MIYPPRLSPSILSRFLLLACFVLALTGLARAETIKFPADGSCVVFDVPTGWKVSDVKNDSLRCTSGDGKLTFTLTALKSATDDEIKTEVGKAMEKLAQDNGLDASEIPNYKERTNDQGLRWISFAIRAEAKSGEATMALVVAMMPGGGKYVLLRCASPMSVFDTHREFSSLAGQMRAAKK